MRFAAPCRILASLICFSVAQAQDADTIYHGGEVVSIDDANPSAQALAVKNGKIVAVGRKTDAWKSAK